jgi:hypothetical protein
MSYVGSTTVGRRDNMWNVGTTALDAGTVAGSTDPDLVERVPE